MSSTFPNLEIRLFPGARVQGFGVRLFPLPLLLVIRVWPGCQWLGSVQVFPSFWYFIQEWNKGIHGSRSSKVTLFSPQFYWVEIWRREELVRVVLTQKVSMHLSSPVMTPRKRPCRVREVRRKWGLSFGIWPGQNQRLGLRQRHLDWYTRGKNLFTFGVLYPELLTSFCLCFITMGLLDV